MKGEIEELEFEQVKLTKEIDIIAKWLQQEMKMLDELSHWPGNKMLKWDDGEQKKLVQIREAVAYALSHMEKRRMLVGSEKIRQSFCVAGKMFRDLYGRVLISSSHVKEQLKENQEKINELQQNIRDLQNSKRTYPKSVQRLKTLLEQRLGHQSEALIFCEELEIEDDSWRDAIEGYLNTQKFDLLVEPHVFVEALSIYEREKRTHRLEGIGLVDSEKEKNI